ncbi:3-oxoacyl-[acyl-carrier-protein] reductase [Fusibacter sp. 3D3]|uniref:3-oxoacyl-[acyl-carrier-protein] reductase n=1 Tax=Fusibacter sp. 3D3 TaxID=1048380 RepID=UPI00085293AB|nr:3-oxoacyl-[acyl-carrier-protein] reductase [Fusibacter sp. 3D3]GAU79288.1 3-oxoacyl-[acyl-carrier protein] reductase [Fusibacter sp. 3D3]
MRLENKTALITGGSRGIGRDIAIKFAEEGADIIFLYRSDAQSAQALATIIESLGRKVFAFQVDVSNFDEVLKIRDAIEKKHKKIDILVNNAGVLRDSLFMKMSDSDWHTVIDINLTGVFNCTKAFLELLYRENQGVIVNIASIAGIYGNVGQTNYSASKAGIIGFTKALAKEAARYKVRVNCIAPGFIETGIWDDLPPKVYEAALKKIAVRKMGLPEHVSKTAVFLASEASSYITGQVVEVDGGIGLSVI